MCLVRTLGTALVAHVHRAAMQRDVLVTTQPDPEKEEDDNGAVQEVRQYNFTLL